MEPTLAQHVEPTPAQHVEPTERDEKRANVESGNDVLETSDDSATGQRRRRFESANEPVRISATMVDSAVAAGMKRVIGGAAVAAKQRVEATAADQPAGGEGDVADVVVLTDLERATGGNTAPSERLAPAATAAAVARAAIAEATLVQRNELPLRKESDSSLGVGGFSRGQACNGTSRAAAEAEKSAYKYLSLIHI